MNDLFKPVQPHEHAAIAQELLQEANENCTKINVAIDQVFQLIPHEIYEEILNLSEKLKKLLVNAHNLNSGLVTNESNIS